MKKLKLLLLLSFLTTSVLFSQNEPCGTEILHKQEMQTDPEYKEEFLLRQNKINKFINAEKKKNGNRFETDVIPVVFHILHLGEPVGVGSNISDAEIMQSFDQLNQDFANSQGDGVHMTIQFCLAERDPDGNPSDGINRVNGTVNSSYVANGITSGGDGNEAAVKALSIWPNSDYINIWVVYSIDGPSMGYAYFPGAADNIDGLVLDDLTFTDSSYGHTITHQMGHFFDLYHTFHDASDNDPNTCPPNTSGNCDMEGDFCCDTRPHTTTSPFSFCNEDEFLECDNDAYTFAVHKNYLNYIDNSCMSIFTLDQVGRANAVLNTSRYSLTQSLGCQPPCPDLSVDFTMSDNTVYSPETINFTNTSTGGISSSWNVDGNTFSTEDLSYTFNDPGNYYVCLTETSASDCEDNNCQTVQILGLDPCVAGLEECNLVLNGNLVQLDIPIGESCHNNDCEYSVCNWDDYPQGTTPFYCNNNGYDNTVSLAAWNEGISTESQLNLVNGQSYTLSLEYLHRTNYILNDGYLSLFEVGLVDPVDGMPSEELLGQINNPSMDIIESSYLTCDHETETFNSYTTNFTYFDGMPLHLFLRFSRDNGSTTGYSFLSIKNIMVSDCATCIPDVNITIKEECPYIFNAQNIGDGDTYIWEFCDGTMLSGQSVTHNPPPGDCQVCVTVYCSPDQEFGTTFCENFEIEECPSYICQVIDDFGQDNIRENSGKDILALKETYTFVGNLLHEEIDEDHYVVTRDYDNELITTARIGDYDDIESDIEQSTAITMYGKYKYVTGYTDTKDEGKDIYVAKLGEYNNIIWCKIYDYGELDQEGTGIQVVKPALGSQIPRIYVTGHTITQDGTTDMFLLHLSDNPSTNNSGGQVIYFRIYGTNDHDERAYDLLKVGKNLLMVGDQSSQHATVIKVNFAGQIQEQFSLETFRTRYNSVSADGTIGVAVGKQGSKILITGFNLNDLSIIFNRSLSSKITRTEEAMDIIYRASKFYMVGRSSIIEDGEVKDDGFFISFRIANQFPFLVDEQLTDLPVDYSESFNAIDQLGSADLVMIGDIQVDDEYNDIFFVKTNPQGENCCMKKITFKAKNVPKLNYDCCGTKLQSLKTNRYGRREYDYNKKDLCDDESAFSESISLESRSAKTTQRLRVSPNPSTGIFLLELNSGATDIQISKTSIVDISGKVVFRRDGDNQNATIDMTRFDSGIYIVHCVLNDGSTLAEKIILVH